ncbi:MAG: hypothetical protein KBC64_00960 [Simkaniaceae bacterium]|nr:hypothetical protein [Simkaniaceae bacterium]
MLLPLAVVILACANHHPVPEQEVSVDTECEVSELQAHVVKKKAPSESEEETLLIEEAQKEEEARHIVTFSETETPES